MCFHGFFFHSASFLSFYKHVAKKLGNSLKQLHAQKKVRVSIHSDLIFFSFPFSFHFHFISLGVVMALVFGCDCLTRQDDQGDVVRRGLARDPSTKQANIVTPSYNDRFGLSAAEVD
jgi:hypothetical protein